MKTLKKTLCVVLAVVMAVGTLAITASATDFADDADITYKEAVGVLTALGVIDGTDNNRFDPDGTLTRAQGAKIIAYAVLGPDTAELLRATSNPFDDVKASSWMAGAVSYCVDQGIIAGVGNNKFDPNGTLTGVAFAKMFLEALGVEGQFENTTAWANNVVLAAQKIGLANGISGFNYYDAISREEACQMAFNAINYGESKTSTVTRYLVMATASGTQPDNVGNLYDTYAAAQTASSTGTNAGKVLGKDYTISAISITDSVAADSIAKTVFSLSTTGDLTDNFGRPSTNYYQNGKLISSFAESPVAVYTSTVTTDTIYKALGLNTGTTGTVITGSNVYTNGVKGTDGTDNVTIALNGKATVGGEGIVTEIYDLGGGSYRIVKLVSTLGQITNVTNGKETNGSTYTQYTVSYGSTPTTFTGKVYTSALNGEKDSMSINGSVARNSYITFYTVGGVTYVTPVSTVAGVLTSYSSANGYNIGGKYYLLSDVVGASMAGATYNTSATYMLDAYGYVLGPAGTTTVTNYLYLVQERNAYTLNGTTLQNSVVGDIIMPNGTVSTVTIDSINGTAASAGTGNDATDRGLYSYNINSDGEYVLGAKITTQATDNAFTAGSNVVKTGSVYANNATLYIYANWNTDKTFANSVNTVTGYANVTGATGVDGVYIDTNNDGIAETVIVYTYTDAGASVSYAYYLGTASTTDGKNFTYDFNVNGVATSIKLTAAPASGIGMYSISGTTATAVNFDETSFTMSNKENAIKNATLSYNNGVLMLNNTYAATVGANVPVYTYTGSACATSTASALASATGNVIIVTNGTAITAIYVVA